MLRALVMLPLLAITAICLSSCTGTGQYQNLNSKAFACGYPKADFANFHDCMKTKVVASKDPFDYYSITANDFLGELASYRELVDKREITNAQAMEGINKFVIAQAELEREATQRGAAITAGLALGIGAAACVNNGGCGGGGHSYYKGNCECPKDIAADGSVCGARSAWSRSGGATPFCPAWRI